MRAITQEEINDIVKLATSTSDLEIDSLGIKYAGYTMNAQKNNNPDEYNINNAIVDIMALIASLKAPNITNDEIVKRAEAALK